MTEHEKTTVRLPVIVNYFATILGNKSTLTGIYFSMSQTPNTKDKKRAASSPLDLTYLKKTRTISVDSTSSSMDDKLKVCLDDTQIKQITDLLKDTFESKLSDMVSTIVANVLEGVQNKLSVIQDENICLKARVEELESRIKYLEHQEDQASQYSRRNCLRVSGIKEEEGESMENIVMSLATEIKAEIDIRDIDNVHRLGSSKPSTRQSQSNQSAMPSNIGRPRDIIIKFTSFRSRQIFYTRRSALKTSKVFGRVFVNEELSKKRGEVFFHARRLAKAKQVKSAWTANGVILVKDNSERIHRCERLSDLDKFNA